MVKKNKNTIITIVGIGRVGLPLALVFADAGFTVYGVGIDLEKINEINSGIMPFLEEGAQPLLRKLVGKYFFASSDYSHIEKSDYIILTVGTPVDENMNPVYDQITSSIAKAKRYFKQGQTLILRSTLSPRTTQYVKALIEEDSSLQVGKNFFLAFCPERISEGNAIKEIKDLPQIIGGVDKQSAKTANELFEKICPVTILTDDVSAELAKLFTNMYRYINFAIANEFMVLADNYHKDIYEIVELVNYKYKRGGLSMPGLTAGPCLFKDGFFLISDLPFTDLISTSWKINEAIPLLLVKRIRERVRLNGKKAVILGLGYKNEIDDIRDSLSFKVRKALLRERAQVVLHDPYVKEYVNQQIEKNVYKVLEEADVIFIATKHKQYKKLNIAKVKRIVKKNCIICDVWNVLGTEKIVYKLNSING